ncbi:MAG: DUF3786 domain-containing protein [Clostridia bacterium]|nr:DUF3786 domain-containing protein [Clostridia bacterium]
MDNYEIATIRARPLFLKWDQEKMIRKYRLEADEKYLYIRFLGEKYRIERVSGAVECIENGVQAADFSSVMTIYDYLCRENEIPGMSGKWTRIHSVKHAGQTSPNDVKMYQKHADHFQLHQDALKYAAAQMGRPFPTGDIAFIFPIFDGFDGIFQFWEGDEEFPPSARFMWDDNIHHYLKFETIWYAAGKVFDLIYRHMGNFSGDGAV